MFQNINLFCKPVEFVGCSSFSKKHF